MDNILFKNTKILDPGGKYDGKKMDVWVKKGIIQKVGAPGKLKADKSSKVFENANLSPGFVDTAVHLTDPGEEWKDDLESLSESAKRGGITNLITYPNTDPVADRSEVIESVLSRSSQLHCTFHVCGTITEGAKGKNLAGMFDMQSAGAVAFTDGINPLNDAGELQRALQYASGINALLIALPIDSGLAGGHIVWESPETLQLGLKGIPHSAEDIRVMRDLRLLQDDLARFHFACLSSAGNVAAVKSASGKNESISCSVSLAHLLFDDRELRDFDPVYKVFPPLKPEKEKKALLKELQKGKIDCICSWHMPNSREEAELEFASAPYGMANLQYLYSAACTELVSKDIIGIGDLIRLISTRPREIFDLPSAHIEEQSGADLVWHDPAAYWEVTEMAHASKSFNTPFLGRKLKGKVLATYCKGKFSVLPEPAGA